MFNKRDFDPSLPEIEIDHELLVQAMLNIAKNALQTLDDESSGEIKFKTRVERQFTINGERHRFVIRVDISDNDQESLTKLESIYSTR